MNARWILVLSAALLTASLALAAGGCSGDTGGDEEHWFDCRPMLTRMAECDVTIAFDDINEADPGEAYESCQFAKGNMWLAAYKCFKEQATCEDFAECLPEHGFITPAEQEADDDADDDATDDDIDDDASDDDTA